MEGRYKIWPQAATPATGAIVRSIALHPTCRSTRQVCSDRAGAPESPMSTLPTARAGRATVSAAILGKTIICCRFCGLSVSATSHPQPALSHRPQSRNASIRFPPPDPGWPPQIGRTIPYSTVREDHQTSITGSDRMERLARGKAASNRRSGAELPVPSERDLRQDQRSAPLSNSATSSRCGVQTN